MPRFRGRSSRQLTASSERLIRLLLCALVVLSLAVAVRRALFSNNPHFDFSFFYIAGRMWADGIDPYSEAFLRYASDLFGRTRALETWVYPPHWIWLTVPLAALPYDQARLAWSLINLAALGGAVILCWRAAGALPSPPAFSTKAIFAIAVLSCESTRENLYFGQSSIIIVLGLSLVLLGLAQRIRWLQVLGLVVTCLKPQVGLVLLLVFLSQPGSRKTVIFALVGGALASLPALLVIGPGQLVSMASNFISSAQAYSRINLPSDTTGIGAFLYFGAQVALPAATYPLIAGLAGFFVARSLERAGMDPARALIISATAMILFFVPLHTNDLLIAALLLLLATRLHPAARVLVMIGLLILYRPWDLAQPDWALLTVHQRRTLIETFAGSVIAAGVLWEAFVRRSLQKTVPASPGMQTR